jgi:preprotein translocase subunit SecB
LRLVAQFGTDAYPEADRELFPYARHAVANVIPTENMPIRFFLHDQFFALIDSFLSINDQRVF